MSFKSDSLSLSQNKNAILLQNDFDISKYSVFISSALGLWPMHKIKNEFLKKKCSESDLCSFKQSKIEVSYCFNLTCHRMAWG